MSGNSSSHVLGEVLRDLYLEERTGVLRLARDGVTKEIYFDRGLIVFAASSIESEDFGPRLVAAGRIAAGALAEVRRSVSEPAAVARALVNRGLVGAATLQDAVADHVEQIVRSVFQWESYRHHFEDAGPLDPLFESDVVRTFGLILRGAQSMVGFEPIGASLRGLPNHLAVKASTPIPLERLVLSPAHGYILSRIDGTSSVNEILTLLPPGEEDVACRFLYGLIVTGVVGFVPPISDGPFRAATVLKDHADTVALESAQERMILEALAALRERNPHEVLGVPPSPSRAELERAYEEAKERFNRDKMMPRVRDTFRSELALIEGRLIEAFLTLSQARPVAEARAEKPLKSDAATEEELLVRPEQDRSQAQVVQEEVERTAEGYYQKARKYMREGDFHNAIQYAKLAISHRENDARFHALLGECQARNPEVRWQRFAEQSLLRSTELDPWNADYKIRLGRFYKGRGLKHRARKQFEQLLEMIPGHEEARQELDALD